MDEGFWQVAVQLLFPLPILLFSLLFFHEHDMYPWHSAFLLGLHTVEVLLGTVVAICQV